MILKNIYYILLLTFIPVIFWLIQYKGTTVSSHVLLPGAYIQDGSLDLDAGYYSVPLAYDWNADGRNDLLVGLSTSATTGGKGKIKFFENHGTDNVPLFKSSTTIQACKNTCALDVSASF